MRHLSIYGLKLTADCSEDMLIAKKLISPERSILASMLIKEEDKIRSIFSEILARAIISKSLGLINTNIKFSKNKQGKPYLEGYTDFYFNVSHSKDYIIIAISGNEVGVDIENIRKINVEIANKFFSDKEINYLKDRDYNITDFYDIWTLKESYVKMLGLGFSKPLNSFTIMPNGTDTAKLEDFGMNESVSFKRYLLDDYRLSVCSADVETKFSQIEFLDSKSLISLIKLT